MVTLVLLDLPVLLYVPSYFFLNHKKKFPLISFNVSHHSVCFSLFQGPAGEKGEQGPAGSAGFQAGFFFFFFKIEYVSLLFLFIYF